MMDREQEVAFDIVDNDPLPFKAVKGMMMDREQETDCFGVAFDIVGNEFFSRPAIHREVMCLTKVGHHGGSHIRRY